jgi:radical SAM protein with 4Fe4S-binding SPASM domain
VRKDSFREVWATSEVLEAIRDRSRYQGKCGSCPRWAQCRGCRAIAYAFSKANGEDNFLADDPQCFVC